MATLTAEQIEQKKQQLKQLSEEMNALVKELQEAGEWPLDEDDLDKAAGGFPNISHLNPLNRTPITESNPVEDRKYSFEPQPVFLDPIM
jgi:hypothetical protein